MKNSIRSRIARPSIDERVRAYLAACPAAVSGQHGSHRTFGIACALTWGFALSKSEALGYLRLFNQRCEPPWSDAELVQKIECSLRSEYHDKARGYLL
jgi:hypothetical protein